VVNRILPNDVGDSIELISEAGHMLGEIEGGPFSVAEKR